VVLYWITNPGKLYEKIMYAILDINYVLLFTFFTVNFYAFIFLFSLLIWLFGLWEKQCVRVGGGSFADFTTPSQVFSGAFALSWATFSTVGYGNAWPALSEDGEEGILYCPAMNGLLMLEAFIGVCFAGACGAILFGKVVQAQSQAQIDFSQPIVIRFGSGLIPDDVDADADEDQEEISAGRPCPVLEFRLVNRLHALSNGVITDAILCCCASIEEAPSKNEMSSRLAFSGKGTAPSDKVNRVKLPKKTFLDMDIVNNEHPHFKRSWTAMHILNEQSPLLSPKMKSRIRKNHGLWPSKDKYNTAQYIKENLDFEEIIVSFNGLSAHSSSTVNAQKVYGCCDVVIGYQFVSILEKVGEQVKVLTDCLSDVTDQNGNDKPLELKFD